ncbi:hypothetical protein Ancab_032049 [Ancistrocladus abbreviatus]
MTHVSNEYAKPRPIDKVMAISQKGIHVSLTTCSSARVFMAEGIANLKKSKKSDPIESKADTSSVAHTPEGKVASASTNPGPHPQRPTQALGTNLVRPLKPKKKTSKSSKKAASVYLPSNTKPISPGATCTKPTEAISNSKKKGPSKNSSKALSKWGITPPDLSHAVEEQVQAESLHDSNIENMNRIFLNNLSKVSAVDIWEARKLLGVHSDEGDLAVIQRISELGR